MEEKNVMDIAEFMLSAITKCTETCAKKNGYGSTVDMSKFEVISKFMAAMGITDPTKEQVTQIIALVTSIPGSALTKKEVENFLTAKAKRFVFVPWAMFVCNSDTDRNNHNYGKDLPFMLSPMAFSKEHQALGLKPDLTFGNRLPVDTYMQSMRPANEAEIRTWVDEHFKASKDAQVTSGMRMLYVSLLAAGAVEDKKNRLGIKLD